MWEVWEVWGVWEVSVGVWSPNPIIVPQPRKCGKCGESGKLM
ncbi:hypothetical protein [Okeania sp. SIO3I5]|nr:hypothetical protein [Okeania sp. SIO3I5]